MNIKFNGKNYNELFNELFSEIVDEYNLKIEKRNDTTMEMIGDNFVLLFTYDMDTSLIYYINKKIKKTYLMSNYININAEDIDREDVPKIDIISKEIERTLKIQSRVIKRKFTDMLKGNMNWFIDYKNTQFFYEMK